MHGQLWVRAGATLLSCLGLAGAARASGAFVRTGSPVTTVTEHRITIAVAGGRTVLWDAIDFDGAPTELAWVMPVRPGASVSLGNSGFDTALGAVTGAFIDEPVVDCDSSMSGGCACMGTEPEPVYSGSSYYPSPAQVSVQPPFTNGAYSLDMRTGTEENGIAQFLRDNGFEVSGDDEATLLAYAAEGFDFAVARVVPERNATATKPLQVITEGSAPFVPFRLMRSGASDRVNVSVHVIGEGRFGIAGIDERTIDPKALTWDVTGGSSNYDTLRRSALDAEDGRNALVTSAVPEAFAMSFVNGLHQTITYSHGGSNFYNLPDLYFSTARREMPTNMVCPSVATLLRSQGLVVENATVGSTEITAGLLACGSFVDLQIALLGLRPAHTWVTRLELFLPRDALDVDRTIELSSDQSAVSQILPVTKVVNRPRSCEEPVFQSSVAPRRQRKSPGWLASIALVAVLAFRRSWRSDRRGGGSR